MNLEFEDILDRGDLGKERIVFRAKADTELGEYAVFSAFNTESGITNFVNAAYWFPDGPIKAGDAVLLYTKEGVSRAGKVSGEGKPKTHDLYWGRQRPLWDENIRIPILVLVAEWKPFRAAQEAPSSSKPGTGTTG